MPLLSAFTPLGLLKLSSKKSAAELIYNSLAGSAGDTKPTRGSRSDCTLYAQAMGLARARLCLEKAGNQLLPNKTTDLLDKKEIEFGLIPGSLDTMKQRRDALAARRLLPGGATVANITSALAALLGSDFIAYRPTKNSEAVVWPANLGDQPMNLQLPTTPPKILRIASISIHLGTPQAVVYELLSNAAGRLLVGDVVLVDAGNDGQSERVLVTAVSGFPLPTFTAVFNKSHDLATICTTQPWPMWNSTKRHDYVIVTASAANDPEKRRKVNELMARITRGVSTWDIAASSGPGTIGPFTIGSSLINTCPIPTISYP